jgi:ferredoxin
MRVSLDSGTCQGNGFCAQVAPRIFTVENDESTNLFQDQDLPAVLEGAAAAAVEVCPVMALVLIR